jgi:hypothetical protein
MKTDVEINNIINEVIKKYPINKKINALIDVLENDLDESEIEEKYFDEDDCWIEQEALKARQWLDGEITDEELLD